MSDTRHLHSVGEIARMLDARALDIASHVLRGGKRQGREFVAKDFSGAPGTELSVCISGEKQGVWCQFNASPRLTGDMLEFVRLAICGGNRIEAIAWARGFLGVDGGDKAALARTHQAVTVQRRAPGPDKAAAAKREKAYRTYRACRPLEGSLAETYLRGRSIDFSGLDGRLRALLFHPALKHWEGADCLGQWPAMVAPVYDFRGKFLAIHRTWLAARADGSVGKAPVPNPKKVQGNTRGGFVPLWRGSRVDPETGEVLPARPLREAGPGQWVDVTEGIEDAGSVAMHCPEARVFAAISLSNMAAIQWPENVEGINFWRQNDKPGSQAVAAATDVVRAWQRQGKRVRLCTPPPQFKDVNEWLMASLREKTA